MKAIPRQSVEMSGNGPGKKGLDKPADCEATGNRDETFEKAVFG